MTVAQNQKIGSAAVVLLLVTPLIVKLVRGYFDWTDIVVIWSVSTLTLALIAWRWFKPPLTDTSGPL